MSHSRPKLDPIEGILAVLERGSTTGTNKFGLLLALIGLAPLVGEHATLMTEQIAEKLIELHWDHTREYRHEAPLRQVRSPNKDNTTVLLEVIRLQQSVDGRLPFEQARIKIDDSLWRKAVIAVARGTAKNPLRLLQQLPGDPPPFLYEPVAGSWDQIRFIDGALESLVRYGRVLRDLIEFRFVRFVAEVNREQLGTSVEIQLHEHLFGVERHMPPTAMRHDLWILQQRRCLYTNAEVQDPAKKGQRGSSVDHVIPWNRIRLSAAENFTITTSAINSSKSDVLLSPELLSRWVEFLALQRTAIDAIANNYGWPSDPPRVVEIATAEYRHASPTTPVWGGQPGLRALGEAGRAKSLEILSRIRT